MTPSLPPFSRAEAHSPPPPGAVASALVLASDAEGRVLLQLRDDRPGVLFPGLWHPFGGGVEPGETRIAAAAREFEEETGVRAEVPALLPLTRLVRPHGDTDDVSLFRLSAPLAPSDIQLREGAGFAFFTARQIATIPLAPHIQPVLAALTRGAAAQTP